MSTQQKQKVHFTSRARNQLVTMESQQPIYENGRFVGETPGRHIQFKDHVYVTDDQEVIDFLRSRMAIGTQIYESAEPAPDPSKLLRELVTADEERTQEILDAELDGHQREDIIEAAREKLALFMEPEQEE